MTQEEKAREQAIQSLANILRTTPFTMEFNVKKNPRGVIVIYEVTQEQLDNMMKKEKEKEVVL